MFIIETFYNQNSKKDHFLDFVWYNTHIPILFLKIDQFVIHQNIKKNNN